MNFTWFASAYDNDDDVYRLAIPVALYLVTVWTLHAPVRQVSRRDTTVVLIGTAAVVLCVLLPRPILHIGLATALTVGFTAASARFQKLKPEGSRAVDESDGRT